ncbi:ABC transporter permease [Microbacterium sp. SORGH_AS_0428]|uniref:ABC transporter permease n=1 Tax=Microbacterium sp. SORGH_AS_0428 TaxID=3041788 RepID=UPI00286B0209|nr:ABC transporter permease [Microbacterium sp. SORGH_AS_0428]
MYATYLRRELSGRKKQTTIVAAGLAVAIALVIVVTALSTGVRDAQANALESVYGVGTDLTVTGAQTEPGAGGGPRFDFGQDGGSTDDGGTTTLNQSRLTVERMRATLDASTVSTVANLQGVAAASGALALTNSTFSGELPPRPSQSESGTAEGRTAPSAGGEGEGFGGGSFDLQSFSVLGVGADTSVGPLSAVSVSEGRMLDGADAGQNVAVVDAAYAASNSLTVGGTVEVGGAQMQIVGLVASTTDEADTAANVYIPLDVAQTLSGAGDVVSTVYVQAGSSDAIGSVQTAISDAFPDATVSSQSDLASTVSGSLASASALITNLGTWLSVIVLAVAVLLAVLFTISGVTRRTREFGTLKAIGWSNGRVVGQVAGESVVQSLIGGVVGVVLGLVAVGIINLISPTISASSEPAAGRAGFPGAGAGGGGLRELASTASDVVLNAPISVSIIVVAVALSVVAGLVAGAFGGWRAARLSPAEALRAVA